MKVRFHHFALILVLLSLPVMGGACPERQDHSPGKERDTSIFVQKLHAGGIPYSVNNADTIIKVDVIPLDDEEKKILDKLFPDYTSAWEAASRFDCNMLPSVEMINGKLKQVNDGMYAAMELALDDGLSKFSLGKQKWLARICDILKQKEGESKGFAKKAAQQALIYVAQGLLASGAQYELPVHIKEEIGKEPRSFTMPAGEPAFYSWTPKLEALYQQFRLLGQVLRTDPESTAAAALIAAVIDSNPELKAGLETILSFYQCVTNPADTLTVPVYARCVRESGGIGNVTASKEAARKYLDRLKKTPEFKTSAKREAETWSAEKMLGMALIPLLRSKETDLYNRLLSQRNFMEKLIAAIKSEEISLEPTEESGWYEYQQYALEPLLVPDKAREARKIQMSKQYRKRLESAFKTIFAKTRDTHSGHLRGGLGCGGEMVIDTIIIRPELAVEPTATFYLRQARGYRFLLSVLKSCVGQADLKKLKRLVEDGSTPDESLLDELTFCMDLCYGLYAQSCFELGVDPVEGVSEITLEKLKSLAGDAVLYVRGITLDEDFSRDTRILVHVGTMPQFGNLNTMWATIGCKIFKIRVDYVIAPEVVASSGYKVRFGPQDYFIIVDEFLELETPRSLMNRSDFRAMCDRRKTRQAIMDFFREK